MLGLMPFCISVSTLATRKARKLGESVVTSYMAVSLSFASLLICMIDGQDLWLWTKFDTVDWLCLTVTSLGTIFGHTLRFMAL